MRLPMIPDGKAAPEIRSSPDTPEHGGAHAEELELARQVLAGDVSAWQRLVERYAGLVYAVVRRYLRSSDIDDVRTVFVDVLESVRRRKLASYEGRAALSTWLTLVARNEALDVLRRRFGRGRTARMVSRLTAPERTLFRLYYIEGMPLRDVMLELGRTGDVWTIDRFLATLAGIEHRLGDSWLRRLSYDLHAQSVGAASGRMLEYLDHVRDEFQQYSGAYAPEYYLMEREARRTAGKLLEMMETLEPLERRMLQLRFERGWTAREIATELGLESPRGVYSLTDRIIRRLRRLVERSAEAPS